MAPTITRYGTVCGWQWNRTRDTVRGDDENGKGNWKCGRGDNEGVSPIDTGLGDTPTAGSAGGA